MEDSGIEARGVILGGEELMVSGGVGGVGLRECGCEVGEDEVGWLVGWLGLLWMRLSWVEYV